MKVDGTGASVHSGRNVYSLVDGEIVVIPAVAPKKNIKQMMTRKPSHLQRRQDRKAGKIRRAIIDTYITPLGEIRVEYEGTDQGLKPCDDPELHDSIDLLICEVEPELLVIRDWAPDGDLLLFPGIWDIKKFPPFINRSPERWLSGALRDLSYFSRRDWWGELLMGAALYASAYSAKNASTAPGKLTRFGLTYSTAFMTKKFVEKHVIA
jgi:hypothetical protein